jgi:hypothetical protein
MSSFPYVSEDVGAKSLPVDPVIFFIPAEGVVLSCISGHFGLLTVLHLRVEI